MKRKNVIWAVVIVLTCLFTFSIPTASSSAPMAEPQPSQEVDQLTQDQIEQAVLDAVAANSRYLQGKMVANLQVSDITVSADKLWGTAWVVYFDEDIGALIPSEPALAVVHLVDEIWQAFLPSEDGWQNMLYSLPNDLLTKDEKDMWAAMNQGALESYPTQSGYMLPWRGSETSYLSRSVGHDADFTTAHFAFDFYRPGNTVCPSGGGTQSGLTGLNFNIHAAKAGTVWGWKDSVEDCDHSDVNFIVLRNIDDPSIFQLYMHLSQDSIPPALKTVGTPVARGQFIGVVDNTGYSTGSHLHFQVENQPYWPADNPYWARALDFTFDDVDINGGRPRVYPLDGPYCTPQDVCDVFRSTYVSNNYYMGDANPPTGNFSGVSSGDTVNTQTITLSGWGSDSQTGLAYGQLRANFAGTWYNIGPQFNPDFTYVWDLCSSDLQVPSGVISLALLLYDNAGNPAPLVGLRQFIKGYTCQSPPPACVPDANQITLFEDPHYQGGCVKFPVGNYPNGDALNPLGNNDADSILVGANVVATLYSAENYMGHSQLVSSDIGFMTYQWVDSDTLSSMKVTSRTAIPSPPLTVYPANAADFRQGDAIPLSWQNAGGAYEYQVEIYLDTTLVRTLTWQSKPVNIVDSLAQGSYRWRVRGRNVAGSPGEWSQMATFQIGSPNVYPPVEIAPYTDTMETTQAKWARNGQWSYLSNASMAHSGTQSWWYQNSYGDYDNGLPNSGILTSPPISIPAAGYYLQFYYRYQTETQGTTWDQRWVQISVDQGPFINLVQLSDDPRMDETSSWLQIKAINLSAYAGHVVRIRFLFTTMDAAANQFSGWGIDDFSITATPPVSCSENRQDDTPAQAYLLNYDASISIPGTICPNGDYDYYKFFGQAGDRIAADIDANNIGSLLDGYLFLLSEDGRVLAENDDEIYAQLRDPLLNYTLPKDGFYYLKLKAWKHPLLGGDDYFYNFRLYEDKNKPVVAITWPQPGTFLPDAPMTLSAGVSDLVNGVNRVDFYWHSNSWNPGAWDHLGTDRNASDGWSATFNPSGQPEGTSAAFYVKAYDMAGNFAGALSWNLGIDKTPPVTSMLALGASQPSNAFLLQWTASDSLSGVDYVEIQESINGGNWATLPPIPGSQSTYWIVGSPGKTFSYRMHGVDFSGNSETYPTSAEVSTNVPAAGVICFSLDSYDTSGNDNSPANASRIYANGAGQVHNFCNPLSPSYQNDADWIKLDVVTGEHYLVRSQVTSSPSATIISLFAQDGTTLIKEAVSHGFGYDTSLVWTANRTGLVYIRLQHVDGRVIGSEVGSTLSVTSGDWFFAPIVQR